MSHHYLISNLSVTSNRPLRLIQSERVAAERDHEVTLRICSRGLQTPDVDGMIIPYGRANRHHCFYEIPRVGNLAVRHGRQIHMATQAGLADEVADLFILGTGMGTLYHQRRRIPLHATVALFNRSAYAFCGHSGDGKSTLGMALLNHNIPVLTDDVACIHWQNGSPVIASEKPVIKLNADAARYLGLKQPAQLELPGQRRKYIQPIPAIHGRWPLKGIFILEFGDLKMQLGAVNK